MGKVSEAREKRAEKIDDKTAVTYRLFADLHLNEWKDYAKPLPGGRNSRLELQVSALCSLAEAGFYAPPKTCIVAGDIFHVRGSITPAVADAAIRVFSKFAEVYERVFIIPGNHDFPLKSGSDEHVNATVILSEISDNIFVVDYPRMVDGRLCLVPWYSDRQDYVRAIQEGGTGVLISHMAVTGGMYDNGRPCEAGVPPSIFDQFSAVFLGDFHHKQSVNSKVHYIGAPYQMHFGDEGDNARGALDISVTSDFRVISAESIYVEDAHPRFMRVATVEEARKEAAAGNFVRLQVPEDARVKPAEGVVVERVAAKSDGARLSDITANSSVRQVLDSYIATNPGLANQDEVYGAAIALIESAGVRDSSSAAALKLLLVEGENFLSYANFSVRLDRPGVVLLDGQNIDDDTADSNGAGKSAVIEAIVYALFGDTLRGVPVGDVIRAGSKGGCFCRVNLHTRAGDLLQVIRARKHSKFRDGITLIVNGQDVSAANQKETQAVFESKIGVDLSLFRQIAVFGQEAGDGLAGSTDSQRKALFDAMCDVATYDALYNEAKDSESCVLNLVNKTTTELNTQKRLLSAEESHLQSARDMHDHHARGIATRIAGGTEAVNETQAIVQDLIQKLCSVEDELNALPAAEIVTVDTDERDAANYELLQAKSRVTALERDLASVKHETDKLRKSEVCPLCGAGLSEEHKRTELLKLGESAAAIESDLKTARDNFDVITNVKNALDQKYDEAVATMQRNGGERVRLNREHSRLDAEIKVNAERLKRYSEELEKAKTEASPYEEVIKKHEAEIVRITESLAGLENSLEEVTQLLSVAEGVKRLFSPQGLRAFLFDTLLPELMERANTALRILSNGTMSISLGTERRGNAEKITFEAKNALGAPGYSGNSGGQKRKIDLALAWAVSGLAGAGCNLLFVDEAFDALDSTASGRVLELLNSAADANKLIIMTTHRPEFRSEFPQVWTAVKENGISRLETEQC